MKGFKDFIMRGNLIELAVAFIMAGAFAAVVEAFTKVVMGAISKVLGGEPNFDNVQWAGIPVGPFFTALITFLLVALVVYFGIVKPYQAAKARFEKPVEEAPAPTTEDLLAEIRDLLKRD